MPEDIYGATKVATEHLTRLYGILYGLTAVSLRVGWIYGPRQVMQCYLHELLRSAIDARPLRIDRGADQRFHYVWVFDVADACIRAANAAYPRHDVYNITGGEEHTYGEVANLVRAELPSADIAIGPGDLGFYNQPAFDLTRAAQDFGYHPSTRLRDGIHLYAGWLQSHRY